MMVAKNVQFMRACIFIYCIILLLFPINGKCSILCVQLIDRTCASPTPTLEQHLMWDDIAILLRYLLMLSFNNSLDGMQSLS